MPGKLFEIINPVFFSNLGVGKLIAKIQKTIDKIDDYWYKT